MQFRPQRQNELKYMYCKDFLELLLYIFAFMSGTLAFTGVEQVTVDKNATVHARRSGKTNCWIHVDMVSQLQVERVQVTGAKGLRVHKHKAWSGTKLHGLRAPCSAALASFDSKKETLPLQGKWAMKIQLRPHTSGATQQRSETVQLFIKGPSFSDIQLRLLLWMERTVFHFQKSEHINT